jgi:hypothetical protein
LIFIHWDWHFIEVIINMGKAMILVTNIQKSETFAFDTRGLSNLKADTKGKAAWKSRTKRGRCAVFCRASGR